MTFVMSRNAADVPPVVLSVIVPLGTSAALSTATLSLTARRMITLGSSVAVSTASLALSFLSASILDEGTLINALTTPGIYDEGTLIESMSATPFGVQDEGSAINTVGV